jgi:hypothetical protein
LLHSLFFEYHNILNQNQIAYFEQIQKPTIISWSTILLSINKGITRPDCVLSIRLFSIINSIKISTFFMNENLSLVLLKRGA